MIIFKFCDTYFYYKEYTCNYMNNVCTTSSHHVLFQGVKEVEEQWSNLKFSVHPYMKGTSNRGWILGAVDEILQILDDSAMNLGSMSASRFVGPFLNSVQNWEKSLSHISEVLDVCCFDLWFKF